MGFIIAGIYLLPIVITWSFIGYYVISSKISKHYIHPEVKLTLLSFGAWSLVPIVNYLTLFSMVVT